MTFNPADAAQPDSGIFGLPFSAEESQIVLIPVPWEATTSYGGGTSLGPQAILKASRQVDLFDLELGNFYECGIHLLEESREVKSWNETAKISAQLIIQNGGHADSEELQRALEHVNKLSEEVNDYTYQTTTEYLNRGKIVGLLGGDHSCPFGTIKAYIEKYPKMGVLHFDAHADLRNSYEGFENSHASIMHNLVHKTGLRKLVQVGIRDFSEDEFNEIGNSQGRVSTFFDQDLFEMKAKGRSWDEICGEIVTTLPDEVYISFDIDGLDPILCPHTGTPVPGGLNFQEAVYLIRKVVRTGRKIVGFDLNEVAPGEDGNEWDANVGARLLYKICGWTLKSQNSQLA